MNNHSSEPSQRRTGQETNMDVREGAEPEALGSDNLQVEEAPNQSTEAR